MAFFFKAEICCSVIYSKIYKNISHLPRGGSLKSGIVLVDWSSSFPFKVNQMDKKRNGKLILDFINCVLSVELLV